MSGLKAVSIEKESSSGKGVPEGAEILSKETRIRVRKIENGYIVVKSSDIKYQEEGRDGSNWAYVTKEFYSKTDPLEIKLKNKSLADSFKD
jgi:hypothetical protein